MAKSIYEQELFFSKRIRVGPDTVQAVTASLDSLGLTFRSCRITGAGFEHRFDVSELGSITSQELADAERVSISFGLEDEFVAVSFGRIGRNPLYLTQVRIETASKDSVFRVIGVRAMLESRFEDRDEPFPERFTAAALADGFLKDGPLERPPLTLSLSKATDSPSTTADAPHAATRVVSLPAQFVAAAPTATTIETNAASASTRSAAGLDQKKKTGLSMVLVLPIVIAAIAVPIYFWQGSSAEHQAATQDKQFMIEAGAAFRAESLPTTLSDSQMSTDASSFDYRVQNFGRSGATKVHLRCGPASAHGPSIELGTIPANTSKDVHSVLHPRDAIHSQDTFCAPGTIYLAYDDLSGHHVISFDKVGNPISEPRTEDY